MMEIVRNSRLITFYSLWVGSFKLLEVLWPNRCLIKVFIRVDIQFVVRAGVSRQIYVLR